MPAKKKTTKKKVVVEEPKPGARSRTESPVAVGKRPGRKRAPGGS